MDRFERIVRKTALFSLLTGAVWIALGAMGTALMATLGGYLAVKFGLPRTGPGSGGSNDAVIVAAPLVVGAIVVIALALETARRAYVARRALVSADEAAAATKLARILGPARLTGWISLAGGFLALVAGLQAGVVILGQSQEPDALAASVAVAIGLGLVTPAGFLGWWLENEVVKALRLVVSPDGHAWWDGRSWRALVT